MFSKVLLAADLSVASDRVVEYMKTLRALGDRGIEVFGRSEEGIGV